MRRMQVQVEAVNNEVMSVTLFCTIGAKLIQRRRDRGGRHAYQGRDEGVD